MFCQKTKPKKLINIKHIIIIALNVCCVVACAQNKDVVAHYAFAKSGSKTLYDSGGNENHGTIYGAVGDLKNGRPCLRFDGRGDYVDLGKNIISELTGDFSISAWIRLETPLYNTRITNWTLLDCEDYEKNGFILRVDGITGKLLMRFNGGGKAYTCLSSRALKNNENHHILITKKNNQINFFIDFYESGKAEADSYETAQANLTLSNKNQSFDGIIQDFKIYRGTVSAAEILRDTSVESGNFTNKQFWAAPYSGKRHLSEQSKMRLSSKEGGCWVVTSSNANFDTMYSSNLIDGDLSTFWRSHMISKEEWVEIKWDFKYEVNEIKLISHELSPVDKVELFTKHKGKWESIKNIKQERNHGKDSWVFTFPALETNCIKLVVCRMKPGHIGLREIAVFGPQQPMLRLTHHDGGKRWKYILAGGSKIPKKSLAKDSIIFEGFDIHPDKIEPGKTISMTLKLSTEKLLQNNYVLVLTLGEREVYYLRSNYSIVRKILKSAIVSGKWLPGETQSIRVSIDIPEYSPQGKVDIMLNAISDSQSNPAVITDINGVSLKDGKLGTLNIHRFEKETSFCSKKRTTKVTSSKGGTLLEIDGQRTPPIMSALQSPSFDKYHYYTQDASIKTYHLQIYPLRIDAGDYQKRNFDFVANHINNLTRIDPGASVILMVELRATKAWRDSNPEACLYTFDGNRMEESFCSEKYRNEVVNYLTNLVNFVHSQSWSDRVIGYLCHMGRPEGVLSGGPKIGDYNPEAIEAFRDFVRERYDNSVPRLRKAYQLPKATFENIFPDYEKLMEKGFKGGCFFDPETQRLAIDYHEFLATIIPNFLTETCGRIIKDLTNRRVLVGSYWGYLLEDICYGQYSHQATHSYLYKVLQSPNIDFFASPFNYWHPSRHAGEPYLPFQPYDSIRVNNKLHIAEGDHRTFRAGVLDRGRNYSVSESLAIIKRDMAMAIMHGMGLWFSDWTNNSSPDRRLSESFFLDSDILQLIKNMHHIYEQTKDMVRVESAEVAVLVSGPSYFHHDNSAQPIYTDLIRKVLYLNMNMTGVPYDTLIFEDIMKPSVQKQYKCYVFLNSFYMTDDERKIVNKLKRDGKTLLWCYAPGYVSQEGLSLKSIEDLTGFGVNADYDAGTFSYEVSDIKHMITKGIGGRTFGVKTGDISPRFWLKQEVGSDMKVLAKYMDGKIAIAAKDFGSYKSVYSTATYLPIPMLQNIFRFAGCHVFVDEEVYLDSANGFLMLTNSFEKERKIKINLPSGYSSAQDVFTDELRIPNREQTEIVIKPGETAFLKLIKQSKDKVTDCFD